MRTWNRRPRLLAALRLSMLPLLALSLGGTAVAADGPVPPAPPATAGIEILTLPGDARGDAASCLGDLLAGIIAHPEDASAVIATGLLGRYWDLVPGGRQKVRAVLEGVAGTGSKLENGWAQEQYDALLLDLRLADGDRDGLEALARRRGYARHWLAVGPFGWAQRSILDEVFPPEVDARGAGVDLRTPYQTRKGETRWARVPFMPLSAGTGFARALRSTSGACYLMAHVRSETEQDVVLAYGGGAAKVFVNRALAGTVDRHRERLDAAVRFPAHLRAGWNRIVVKTGEWSSFFSLRVATARGHAAPGLTWEEGLETHDVAAFADSAAPLLPSWRIEALSGETFTPERRALLAFALVENGRGEEALATLEDPRVSGPLAGKAWFQILLAEVVEQADHLPPPARRVRAKAALEKALAIDPHHVHARARLADLDLEDDKVKEGLGRLDELLLEAPGHDAARVRAFNVFMEKGWERQAERVLGELEARLPATSGTILAARARWLQAKGDRLALQKAWDKLLEHDRRSLWVFERRRELALASSDHDGARRALEDELAASWNLEAGQADVRRSQLARQLGDVAAASDLLGRAVDARPQDLELREALARALAERGSEATTRKALSLLDDLLEVEPHRLGAQRLRTALRGKVDHFWKEWEFDGKDLVAGSPDPEKYPNAATICLFDQTVTRIRRDGSSSEVIHQAWKILNEDGIERMGKRPQAGELLSVRVFTPSGEVLEPIRAGNSFEMPGLAAGAIVEHEFVVEHGPPGLYYRNGPWYLRDPELQEPFLHSRWIVIAPKGMPIEAIERNLEPAGCKKTVLERGDEVVRIWETFDQERIEPEPLMPPKDEFLPWVKLYERRSFEELAGSYRDRILGHAYVTPSVRAKADEVVARLGKDAGDSARIDALYAFVKEHVRQPQGGETAAQILAARGGSQRVLFSALLAAAGVPFRHGVASASPDADTMTDWEHPEPGQFFAELLHLEPRDGPARWVAVPQAKYAPLDYLPSWLWGAPVFTLDDSGGLDVLPRGAPSEHAVRSVSTVQLRKGGSCKVHFVEQRGIAGRPLLEDGYGLKETVKNAPKEQLSNFAAQRAGQLFTGAHVKSWKTPDLEDPKAPFTIVLDLEADEVVRPLRDGTLTLAPVLERRELKKQFGGRATRKFDLVLSSFLATRDSVTVDLGPYAAPRLPADVLHQTKFGQYSLTFARDGGKIRIERALTFFPKRVTPAEYKSFLGFLDKADAAERRPLIVELRSGE